MKSGIELIAEERLRQIEEEGRTALHDDQHVSGELTMAAIAYPQAADEHAGFWDSGDLFPTPMCWPAEWCTDGFNADRKNPVRSLAKAGALIAAEIDRLQREKERSANALS